MARHVVHVAGTPWPAIGKLPGGRDLPSDWLELYNAGVLSGDHAETVHFAHLIAG